MYTVRLSSRERGEQPHATACSAFVTHPSAGATTPHPTTTVELHQSPIDDRLAGRAVYLDGFSVTTPPPSIFARGSGPPCALQHAPVPPDAKKTRVIPRPSDLPAGEPLSAEASSSALRDPLGPTAWLPSLHAVGRSASPAPDAALDLFPGIIMLSEAGGRTPGSRFHTEPFFLLRSCCAFVEADCHHDRTLA